MEQPEREALRAAVEHLHGCSAFFMASETVVIAVQGRAALQREVAAFVLGRPTSPVVFAWLESGATAPTTTTHHRVVLRAGQVQSAHDAIRFALLLPPPESSAERTELHRDPLSQPRQH